MGYVHAVEFGGGGAIAGSAGICRRGFYLHVEHGQSSPLRPKSRQVIDVPNFDIGLNHVKLQVFIFSFKFLLQPVMMLTCSQLR